MTYILTHLLSFLLLYKYTALFIIIFSIAIAVPLPSNLFLLATGAFSSLGYFNFNFSLFIATIAFISGDLIDYFLAYHYGEQIFKWLRLDRSRHFNRIKKNAIENAPLTIFLTRFVGPLDQIVSLFSGSIKVPFRIFITYDILGNFVSTIIVIYIGYIAGVYWQNFSGLIDTIGGIILIIIVIFLSTRIFLKRYKKNNI